MTCDSRRRVLMVCVRTQAGQADSHLRHRTSYTAVPHGSTLGMGRGATAAPSAWAEEPQQPPRHGPSSHSSLLGMGRRATATSSHRPTSHSSPLGMGRRATAAPSAWADEPKQPPRHGPTSHSNLLGMGRRVSAANKIFDCKTAMAPRLNKRPMSTKTLGAATMTSLAQPAPWALAGATGPSRRHGP